MVLAGTGGGRRSRARREPAVLSVAGADSSGASGVYRDVATFEALGYAGVAAITAITAQNTSRFVSAEPVPARMISEQIGAVFEDFDVRAVKVGMVGGGEAIAAVRAALRRGIGGGRRRRAGGGGRSAMPVVVDPVVRSTTGGTLLDKESLGEYRASIVPLATAITPNLHELGVLAGRRLPARAGAAAVGRAALAVVEMGAGGVVATGVRIGRRVGDIVVDGAGGKPVEVTGGRAPVRGSVRGSGCLHSAALAARLASGEELAEAAREAAGIAYTAITGAAWYGHGIRVAAAVGRWEEADREPAARILENAASMFTEIPGIGGHMPECQSNIAYAHGRPPASPSEVWGLDGRIVSTMSGRAIVPGRAALGASRHVAAALVEASKRFPGVRAAANIRYDPRDMDAARRTGMAVSSYDRAAEPEEARRAEGSSVRWGVREALRGARRPRDVVYHTGAAGKEPMAVVFGKSPRDVVSKVSRIVREARRAGAAPPH